MLAPKRSLRRREHKKLLQRPSAASPNLRRGCPQVSLGSTSVVAIYQHLSLRYGGKAALQPLAVPNRELRQ